MVRSVTWAGQAMTPLPHGKTKRGVLGHCMVQHDMVWYHTERYGRTRYLSGKGGDNGNTRDDPTRYGMIDTVRYHTMRYLRRRSGDAGATRYG